MAEICHKSQQFSRFCEIEGPMIKISNSFVECRNIKKKKNWWVFHMVPIDLNMIKNAFRLVIGDYYTCYKKCDTCFPAHLYVWFQNILTNTSNALLIYKYYFSLLFTNILETLLINFIILFYGRRCFNSFFFKCHPFFH